MKNVVKSMLVIAVSFSLVVPVGPVWADAKVNIEVEMANARLRREAKRFEEEQKRAKEHAEAEIMLVRDKLSGHLSDVKNGIVFKGLVGNFLKALENDDDNYRAIFPRLKAEVQLITNLSHRLKSLSVSYEKKYGFDEDYSWAKFQKDLELNEEGQPIIKVDYQGKELELDLSTFDSDTSDEE
ncbi:MAG: hypothetical protein AAB309_00270, partial [Deltaproteobacteria bacterium]